MKGDRLSISGELRVFIQLPIISDGDYSDKHLRKLYEQKLRELIAAEAIRSIKEDRLAMSIYDGGVETRIT
jgi:hypothetical protein